MASEPGPEAESGQGPPAVEVDGSDTDAEAASAEDLSDDGPPLASPPPFANFAPLTIPFVLASARIRTEQILEHPTRKRIFEEIRRRPGIHYRELLRSLGISNGTLAYHLRQLENAGCVRSARAHGRKLLRTRQDELDGEVLLLTDRDRELLILLSEARASRMDELGVRCGLKASGVEHHLRRLRALGLVQTSREGRALVFACVPNAGTPRVCTTNHTAT